MGLIYMQKKAIQIHAFQWQTPELEKLLEGVEKFGCDHRKIADFIGTRERDQVGAKLLSLRKKYKTSADADDELSERQIGLIHIKKRTIINWTEEENAKYIEAVRLYGFNWIKIQEIVGTKDNRQCSGHKFILNENRPRRKH